MLSGHQRIT